jgi:hypothetical protein
MNRLLTMINADRIVICQTYLSSETDYQWRMYDIANYLLLRGNYTYICYFAGKPFEYYPEFDIDLGAPLNSAGTSINNLLSSNLYIRSFEKGKVIVNSNDTTSYNYSIPTDATYTRAVLNGGGTIADNGTINGSVTYQSVSGTVSIPPHTAMIILKNGTAPTPTPTSTPSPTAEPVPVTVTLNASADAQIKYNANNGGADTELQIYVSGYPERRVVTKFDLSSIPAGKTITQATLRLNCYAVYNTVTGEVHRSTKQWVEGTGNYNYSATNGVTWTKYNSSSNWTTAGGDYDTTVSGTATISTTGWKEWTITGLVQSWYNGTYTNNGLELVQPFNNYYAYAMFRSREYSDSSLRPQLVITYQ